MNVRLSVQLWLYSSLPGFSTGCTAGLITALVHTAIYRIVLELAQTHGPCGFPICGRRNIFAKNRNFIFVDDVRARFDDDANFRF